MVPSVPGAELTLRRRFGHIPRVLCTFIVVPTRTHAVYPSLERDLNVPRKRSEGKSVKSNQRLSNKAESGHSCDQCCEINTTFLSLLRGRQNYNRSQKKTPSDDSFALILLGEIIKQRAPPVRQ